MNGEELTVSNPGCLPRGITAENLLWASQSRSRILSDAFFRTDLVERTGRGLNHVFEWTLRNGRTMPALSRTDAHRLVVTVPVGSADLSLVCFLITHADRRERPFSLEGLIVLHTLQEDPRLTLGELAESVQRPQNAMKTVVTRMVEEGRVEMNGKGRARDTCRAPAYTGRSARP